MGGDLPTRPANAHAPGFIVQAAKDPVSGNLDRLQIVKVWLDAGTYREKVYDVVWSSERRRDPQSGRVPPVRSTVDLHTATYANSVGAAVLDGVWRDPAFDPKTPAVYYAPCDRDPDAAVEYHSRSQARFTTAGRSSGHGAGARGLIAGLVYTANVDQMIGHHKWIRSQETSCSIY